MKFAFIIDPISKLDPGHDTSVALMEAALAKGHEVWITEIDRLSIVDGKAWGTLEPVELVPVKLVNGLWVAATNWYEVGKGILKPIEEMDAVFMRVDPPVNVSYLYATYILDFIDPSKTLVINSPAGLRSANEKVYALQFQSVIPETIVSQDKAVIRQFVAQKKSAVLKPLGGKGGEGILFLQESDRNFNSAIEISTKYGLEPVMIQTYLPAAKDGDKRVILLDGEPIGAVNRIPSGAEFRGNMAVGGRVEAIEINQRDREISATLAPRLRQDGLYFVGIDIIGGYLTEVNVTSPTGIREIDRLDNINLGQQVITWLEKKLLSK